MRPSRYSCLLPLLLLLAHATPASAARTSLNAFGSLKINGRAVFPIQLSYGPPLKELALWRQLQLDGVDVYKVKPAYTPTHRPWLDNFQKSVQRVHDWDAQAVQYGAITRVNLCRYCGYAPKPEKSGATVGLPLLQSIAAAIKDDTAFGLYGGPDEPYLNGVRPSNITTNYHTIKQYDPIHLWFTGQASTRASTAAFRPYAAVTDIAGVGRFPIRANPLKSTPLYTIGQWMHLTLAAQPNKAVWMTLGLCAAGTHAYTDTLTGISYKTVTPTTKQYRFMIWDAIINGARGLNFFGGHMKGCWNASDATLGWNWHAWRNLEPSIRQVRTLNNSLVGKRVRVRTVGNWEGVNLHGGVHIVKVRANIMTHEVRIS